MIASNTRQRKQERRKELGREREVHLYGYLFTKKIT
jgi:hypothetical protein